MPSRDPEGLLTAAPAAFLIDLDGTLYTSAGPVPGAVDTINTLRRRGVPYRFVTNTTRRPRAAVVEHMRRYGFSVDPAEIFTAIHAARALLRAAGVRTVAPFLARESLTDLADFELAGGTASLAAPSRSDAVVVGDLGAQWTPALLNEAFRYVLDGAQLVALQRDRYWMGNTGLELDAGPYVAAIEYAAGVNAVVCGKPTATFYRAALAGLPEPAAMIGDDLWADVEGAQQAGLQGWLVKTGKFRPDVLERSGVKPDRILGSIAELGQDPTAAWTA